MIVQRIIKFGLVGVVNTLIDFVIFNILSGKRFGFSKIKANLVSTTVAMTFSFLINKRFVFEANGGNYAMQVAAFLAVTAFGLYVLQNIVIYGLTEVWTFPGDLATKILQRLGLGKLFKPDFVMKNTAKLAATAVSLVWNYLLYQQIFLRL